VKFIRMRRPSVSLILMTKIRADHHQTEIKLDLTLETKTLHVARVLDRDSISISIHFNGFYKGRYRAVTCNFILDDFSQKFQMVGRSAQISDQMTPLSTFT